MDTEDFTGNVTLETMSTAKYLQGMKEELHTPVYEEDERRKQFDREYILERFKKFYQHNGDELKRQMFNLDMNSHECADYMCSKLSGMPDVRKPYREFSDAYLAGVLYGLEMGRLYYELYERTREALEQRMKFSACDMVYMIKPGEEIKLEGQKDV